MTDARKDVAEKTISRLKKMAEHKPRETGPDEDDAVRRAASEGLAAINYMGTAACSQFVRCKDGRILRVEVRVVEPPKEPDRERSE